MKAFFDLPFIQVALPIIIAFALATISQNKRFDDMGKRFDDVGKRFDHMGVRLTDLRSYFNARFDALDKRLDKIEEERNSIIHR